MKVWRVEFRLGDQEGKFEARRIDLMFGGLIEGQEGRYEAWGADLKPGGPI